MGFRNPASVPASIFLHFVTGHPVIFTPSSSSGLIFPTGSKLLRRPWDWLIAGVGVVLTEAFNKIGADLESGFLVAEKRSRLSVREGIHWRISNSSRNPFTQVDTCG